MAVSLRYFERWLLKFGTFLAGCLFCFYLQSRFGLSPVISAALTGFLGSFIPDAKRIESTHVHATIYMGAFVAMGSKVVTAGAWQIVFVSLLGSTIYFFMVPHFKGLGGRLGLIAFISSLLGVALRFWL